MAVPRRFAIEYPQRALELIRHFEEAARHKDLVGSFGLLAAAAVLTIPYERMKAAHPLHHRDRDSDLAAEIKRLEKTKFLKAPFWRGTAPSRWRQSRIMASVERVDDWMDEKGQRSLSPVANTIDRRTAEEVIRVLRNALSHGNIIYLDKDDRETVGQRVESLAFLARYEERPEPGADLTYRVVVVPEEDFLRFVKTWAEWVGSLPIDAGAVV